MRPGMTTLTTIDFSCFSFAALFLYSTCEYLHTTTVVCQMANYSSTIIDKHNGKQEFDWTHKMTWPGAENLDKNQGLGHGPVNHPCSQRPNSWFTRRPDCGRACPNNASNRGLSARTNNNDDNSTTNHRMPVSMPTGPGPPTPCSTATATAILSLCRYPLLLLPLSIHVVLGALDVGQSALPPAILVRGSGLRALEYCPTCSSSPSPSLRPPSNPPRCVPGLQPQGL